MAMHHLGLTSRHSLTRPSRRERDAFPPPPLVQALAEFREELAVGIVTQIGVSPMNCQGATKGRPMDFAKSTASMMLVACGRVM